MIVLRDLELYALSAETDIVVILSIIVHESIALKCYTDEDMSLIELIMKYVNRDTYRMVAWRIITALIRIYRNLVLSFIFLY